MNNKIKYGIAGLTGVFIGAAALVGVALYGGPYTVVETHWPETLPDCVTGNKELASVSKAVELKTTKDGAKFCMYTPFPDLPEGSITPKPAP